MLPHYALTPKISEIPPWATPADKSIWDVGPSDLEDRRWRHRKLSHYPSRFANAIAQSYREIYQSSSFRDANLFLLELTENFSLDSISLASNDEDLIAFAKRRANECRRILTQISSPETAYLLACQVASRYGVASPQIEGKITLSGALQRFTDDLWWRRQIRHIHGQNVERHAISLGLVHRHAGLYASNESVTRIRQQKRRNKLTLEGLEVVNEDGEIFSLDTIAALSVANPRLRRNELMVRAFGFETIAKQLGHVGIFPSITCPSRMHARLQRSGKANPKYDGTTPREAQKYLCRVWARIRAKLKRDGIDVYGFRVVEPHHDGTPHWHLLLFVHPSQVDKLIKIMRHYVLQEDSDEPGAKERRLTVTKIDWNRGSATGYIAKYIAKNIDGQHVGQDEFGNDAQASAERVGAWSSTWRVRQFQQIGGAPVSLWRELRRADGGIPDGILKDAFKAADKGDWAEFLKVLGGATPKRKDLPVRLAKAESNQFGKYGEPVGLKVVGVTDNREILSTRLHQWTIRPKPSKGCNHSRFSHYRECSVAQPTEARTDARVSAHRADGTAAVPPLEFCQ